MSVPGVGSLRLRLFFDYPPPSTPESCQCWLLLDLSKCRLVTDLSSLIRSRFGFSQRSRLSLYLEECLLPPCEAIGVVRDNDCIRVKLEEVVTYEDFDSGDDAIWSARKASKRAAQVWEKKDLHQKKKKHDFETSPSKSLHLECREVKKKSKKRKSSREGTRDSSPGKNNADLNQKKTQKKRKKDRSKALELEKKNTDASNITKVKDKVLDDSVNSEKINTSKKIKLQIVRTGRSASESDSTSTSSLSSNKASSKLKPLSNKSPAFVKKKDVPQPVTANATTETATKDAMASKLGPSVKPVISTTGKPSASSSDSDINKEGTGSTLDKKRTQTDSHFPDAALKPQQEKVSANPESSDSSDSSDSDSFVIKKPRPVPSLVGNGDVQNTPVLYGPAPHPSSIGRGVARGCGRGQDTVHWRGSRGRGFRGRVRGRGRGNANHFPNDYSTENAKQEQLNHSVTNRSIIIQNPPETPKKDYSAMPLLAAPPPVGQKIAFKLLELTENYTPEMSEYKEGKIINYSPVTQQLDLEVSSASGAVKIPGKFDLVYESEGGGRYIEYAIPQDTKITQSWSSLIEPRLIVEMLPVSEAATNQSNGGPVVLPQQNV